MGNAYISRLMKILKISYTIGEVLFGMPVNDDVFIKLFNFIILILKWFINKKK